MIELLQYGFMQKAILAAFFTVLLCAVAGVLVVVNRFVFVAGGVSHASYGGIGLALWLGLSPGIGAVAVAVILGLVLALIRRKDPRKADALVTAFWSAGMAAGIMLSDITPGYKKDFLNYLFGDLMLVSNGDLFLTGTMAFVILILTIKYYKTILSVSADRNYSVTLGIPVKTVETIMLVVLCVAVVALMKVAGLILVMALLSMPASIAETRVRTLSGMMVLSGIIAFIVIFSGLWLSVWLNVTPSALIVLILTFLYMINGRIGKF